MSTLNGAGSPVTGSPVTGSPVTGAHLERASAALATAIAGQGESKPAGLPQPQAKPQTVAPVVPDVIDDDEERATEHFLPVTRGALVDRLAKPQAWAPGVAPQVRRFFRYLDFWRQQRHAADLLRLTQAYEPFSPDSDLFVTRQYTDLEREDLQKRGRRRRRQAARRRQLRARRPQQDRGRDPHQGKPLRPRPEGRLPGVRGVADLLSRRFRPQGIAAQP